jgi:hypothetical protein
MNRANAPEFGGCEGIAPGATLRPCTNGLEDRSGFLRTAWFAKTARKALIQNDELCSAIRQVMMGQADDLGGGVFKKRLDKNRSRSIILAKGGRYWVYEYLFAKKDRDNIEDSDLAKLRKLAKAYEALGEQRVKELIDEGSWMEICNDD